jgi:sulfotransferase family protein
VTTAASTNGRSSDLPLVCVLSPPRSFSTVVAAMLGQHPQLYGLAETHLLSVTTVDEWWRLAAVAPFPMTHGLLRSVAEVVFGEQSTESVRRAAALLRARSGWSNADVLALLADRVHPRTLVEKSPVLVFREESMFRAAETFPNARFIHLTRHPRSQALSVEKHIRESLEAGSPMPRWLRNLGWSDGTGRLVSEFDPQRSWYTLNANIDRFVSSLPSHRWLRVRGEDILRDPWRRLAEIASWLALRVDRAAVGEMLHPERSPFAGFGPPGALYGNDLFFLRDARLRPERAAGRENLEDRLEWRGDAHFKPEVVALARRFGYE